MSQDQQSSMYDRMIDWTKYCQPQHQEEYDQLLPYFFFMNVELNQLKQYEKAKTQEEMIDFFKGVIGVSEIVLVDPNFPIGFYRNEVFHPYMDLYDEHFFLEDGTLIDVQEIVPALDLNVRQDHGNVEIAYEYFDFIYDPFSRNNIPVQYFIHSINQLSPQERDEQINEGRVFGQIVNINYPLTIAKELLNKHNEPDSEAAIAFSKKCFSQLEKMQPSYQAKAVRELCGFYAITMGEFSILGLEDKLLEIIQLDQQALMIQKLKHFVEKLELENNREIKFSTETSFMVSQILRFIGVLDS